MFSYRLIQYKIISILFASIELVIIFVVHKYNKTMNWKGEAKDILDWALDRDTTENAILSILEHLLEVFDYSGVNVHDIKQLIYEITNELECPEEENSEPEILEDRAEYYNQKNNNYE